MIHDHDFWLVQDIWGADGDGANFLLTSPPPLGQWVHAVFDVGFSPSGSVKITFDGVTALDVSSAATTSSAPVTTMNVKAGLAISSTLPAIEMLVDNLVMSALD